MTTALAIAVVLVVAAVHTLAAGGVVRQHFRAQRYKQLALRLRQERRQDARVIRTLEQYLAAYVAEVERLKAEARPAARYVGADGEWIH